MLTRAPLDRLRQLSYCHLYLCESFTHTSAKLVINCIVGVPFFTLVEAVDYHLVS
jgi:hypothetical protein